METDDRIAIVGIGCNFPGGEGTDNFWRVLVKGRNCTAEIPSERFNTEQWYDANDNMPGKSRTKEAALIEGFNEFDNKLFGISDAEAERIDPQQKLLLECSYRALEDAGIPTEDVAGSRIGVFVGLMNQDFTTMLHNFPNTLNHYDATGSAASIAANRISYAFNLTGPSLSIDTACSSSLVALHFACLAIKQGDCEAALCGGASSILDPVIYVVLSKAKMISPEGISRPFSKTANGYGRGEGCGIVLVKPLRKALEDCNKIWGVINFSAVNQDGRSVTPITRPSQKQQEKLLESIYSSHINPSIVQYIEAHGTGTPAGDPTEAESIGNIIGRRRPRNAPPLKIGSVKGNIGHTESAAGVAGLIKVVLMMKHEKIVPSLHYSESGSSINTEKLNLSIPTEVEKWEESLEFGRVAGINSFGYGGTNAHVIVKQFKQQPQHIPSKRPYEILILSAASSKSLKLIMEDTAQQLRQNDHVSLQNLTYTSACRRSHANYKYRKAFVTTSLGNLQQQLISATGVQTSHTKGTPQLVYVFCGNGAHYKGMGKVLLRSEPVFREKCQEISNLFLQYAPIRLLDLIEEEFDDFSRPEIAQPLLFLIQVALASLLKFWGIEPITIVGHSVGEIAAAHCAGHLTLEDAVKVIYYRSNLQAKVTGGKMLVAGNIPIEEISKSLDPHSGKVCIAAFNSPNSCTLSGEADAINALREELLQQFGARNIFLFDLKVPAAYHSHMMDPIITDITESIKDLVRQEPEVEIISTVTGQRASVEDFTTSKYWAKNIREPVSFTQAIKASAQGKDNIMFIEIAPKQVLQRNIKETLGKQSVVLPALQAEKDYETLFALVENLFEAGYNLNWPHFYDGLKAIPTEYPRYKFDRQNLNTYLKSIQQQHSTPNSNHPLISSANNNLEITCTISQNTAPYVYEHKNNGVPLVPGALFAEVGLASVMINSRPKIPVSACQLSVSFLSPCVVNQGSLDLRVKLELKNTATEFKILSSSSVVIAAGQVTKIPEGNISDSKLLSLSSIFQRCKSVLATGEVYEILSLVGFQYGNIFKQLGDISYCDELKEGIATIRVNEATRREMYDYHIHPVLLDCFLQMTAVIASRGNRNGRKPAFPSSIGSLVVFRPLEEEMVIYMKANKSTENYLEVCGFFTDKHGQVLAELKHVGITYMTKASANDDFLFENKWIPISPVPVAEYSLESPQFLVFADKYGIAQQLKKYLHSQSKYITLEEWETIQKFEKSERDMMRTATQGFHNVIFMWGIQKLNENSPGTVIMKESAKCCETLRQVVLALREQNARCSVTLVTYRTASSIVDHINPGFALSGMTRCCFVEVPDITFKMIDISFTTTQDIASLAEAIIKYKAEDYPEVWIDQGRMHITEIRHTPYKLPSDSQLPRSPQTSGMFTLYTGNPYKAIDLAAQVTEPEVIHLENHTIEVQVERICIHSEDYFPVSTSSSTFGNSLYWTEHTVEQHQLLALDFSGTVTNIGKGVKEVKVGDHIATCFPVVASSRVLIPEMTCFKTKKLPIFRNTPCVSYFIIAWKILSQILPKPKNLAPLSVICTHPGSILGQVLTLAAKDVGWKASLLSPSPDLHKTVKQCQALIFLPSLTNFSKEMLSDLSNLRDVVVLHGSHQPEFLQQLLHNSYDHIQVHTLNISPIFQKSTLIRNNRAISQWAKSMTFPKNINLTYSIFHPIGSFAFTEPTFLSYFTCTVLPLVVLEGRLPETEISNIPKNAARKKLFQPNAVYIVSGGLTGLGFETVRFIAQNGGGSVVILSRRSPNAEQQQEIQSLENQNKGCKIISLQCDVSVHSEVNKVISSIGNNFPKVPIKGVFHSAVVLDDGHLEALNLTRFEKVLSPKVAGVINLHCATRGHELDYFVCHSSVTSFLGNATQMNYAAANSFLDIFCHYRRNCGLAGQSINWGALNLGLLLNKENLQKFLASKGILTLQKSEIHEYLEKGLLLNNPQQAIAKFDVTGMKKYFFSQVPSFKVRFANLIQKEYKTLGETNTVAHQDSSQMTTKDYIYSVVSELSNTNPKDITMSTSLMSLGMDSMSAMTLQNKLFQDKKVEIPLIRLLDPNTTLMTIQSLLEEQSENMVNKGVGDRNQDTYF
ncbi:6-methylsalicylic acid synthase-like [Trichosurus vulpecula]|uniref:6-methylsalicylic acid synthase-like n=1 Tax=Trichosurus vulpecula TaxID=9337 RepID=UPI00186B0063|nr:6-methylsalicylic acid synthase-like [Trichosurus vulpecula]